MKPDLKIIPFNTLDLGDPNYFAQAYNEYFSSLFNYIRYRVPSSTIADDLTSVSFHKALEKLHTFDPERASFNTWLFTIARNTVNDFLRAEKKRNFLSFDWLLNRADGGKNPEESLLDKEDRHRLMRAIDTLSPKEKDILGLKYAGGNTNRAISEMTGQTESNVGVIIHRSIKKLRKQLATQEENQ